MQIDRTLQPEIKRMEPFSVSKPTKLRMSNGIPLRIIREGDQEVVRLDMVFGAGRWQQSQLLQSLFANRMLREGSRKFSAEQIAAKLDYYGSKLDLCVGIMHSQITIYSLHKYFPQTLEILEAIVKEAIFPDDRLETVLYSNKQQFIVNKNKVSFLGRKTLRLAAFGGNHPMGATATEEDYDRITSEILKEYYQTYYHSTNCSLYLSGYVTAEVVKQVESVFGSVSWGEVKDRIAPDSYPIEMTKQHRIFCPKEDALQSNVQLGWHSLQRSHPDYLKLRVLMTVFGGYFGSRLMSNIREKKGLTYGIVAGIYDFPDTGLGVVTCETATQNVELLIQEIYREMERLRTELIPEEELEMVRNYILGEMARTYEGAFSLAEAWVNIEMGNLTEDYPDRSMKAVDEVSAEELRELAQRYLREESIFEVVAGKEK